VPLKKSNASFFPSLQSIADTLQRKHFEVSAKTGKGVKEALEQSILEFAKLYQPRKAKK